MMEGRKGIWTLTIVLATSKKPAKKEMSFGKCTDKTVRQFQLKISFSTE